MENSTDEGLCAHEDRSGSGGDGGICLPGFSRWLEIHLFGVLVFHI